MRPKGSQAWKKSRDERTHESSFTHLLLPGNKTANILHRFNKGLGSVSRPTPHTLFCFAAGAMETKRHGFSKAHALSRCGMFCRFLAREHHVAAWGACCWFVPWDLHFQVLEKAEGSKLHSRILREDTSHCVPFSTAPVSLSSDLLPPLAHMTN